MIEQFIISGLIIFNVLFGGKEFLKIIKIHNQNQKVIKQKLLKFNLTYQFVKKYLLSDKEYITHLDNIIYMLHQLQKNKKYMNMNESQFFNKFKNIFSTDNPDCMNSQIAKDILNIDNLFKIDIEFYISCFICLNQDQFNQLNCELAHRI